MSPLFPSPPINDPQCSRRTWLTLAAAAAASLAAGCGSGSGTTEKFQATFLQPWQSYETLPVAEWRRRLKLTRDLGCNEIILQWSALYGGSYPWTMPEELIQLLFEEGRSNGIGIRVGLPYDEGWWKVLSGKGTRRVSEFLDRTQAVCMDTLNNSRWPDQAGFRGWYLPYELDQYNWATPERRELLVPWLSAIAEASAKRSAQPLALSTFYSQVATTGTLAGLWGDILDAVRLRPMLQDGVGVAGLGNYAGLEPLRLLLRERSGTSAAFRAAVAREIQHFIAELADYLELENHMPRAFTEAQAEAMVTIVFSAGAEALDVGPEQRRQLEERLVLQLRMISKGAYYWYRREQEKMSHHSE